MRMLIGLIAQDELYSMGTSAGFEWDNGRLGVGVVTRCVRGSFVGVWSADFTLDSMGSYMAAIKADLDGAIFVASADATGQQDGYLIASSSQSTTSLN